MRIDTSIPKSSAKFLYLDTPYRFAFRHIKIALDSKSEIPLVERVVHIAVATILSVPLIGVIIVLAEKILFPTKLMKKKPVEIVVELVEEKVSPIKLKKRSTLDNRSVLNLIEETVDLNNLKPELIEGYANLGKFWTLLERSKTMVAENFTREGYSVLLENADVAQVPLRCQILAGIIECIPVDSKCGDKLELFSKYATKEMEGPILMKAWALNRWNLRNNLQPSKNTMKLIRESIDHSEHMRETTKRQRERLVRAQSERSFKHEIMPIKHGKPINLGKMRSKKPGIKKEDFFNQLDTEKICNEELFINLLEIYKDADQVEKEKIITVMKGALSQQSTTNNLLHQTTLMRPEDMQRFVRLLGEISPKEILIIWGQLITNNAMFLGEEGQKANRLRLAATLKELSMEQLQVSVNNHKFRTLLDEHALIATQSLSFDQLDLITDTASPDLLAKLITGLSDDDEYLYDKLKVMCKIFPTVLANFNFDLENLNIRLNDSDEKSIEYNKSLEKIGEVKSKILTMERVLKGKIRIIDDSVKREELTHRLELAVSK